MEANNLSGIEKAIRENSSFLIFAHKNPDGDAIGSAVCAGVMLKKIGKSVGYAISHDNSGLSKLFEEGEFFMSQIMGEYDVALVLDCSTLDFMDNQELLGLCKCTMLLDHHQTEGGESYCDFYFVDADRAATGEIVYELATMLDVEFDRQMAEALFLSLSSDTGYFKYNNTTARTHEIIASLYPLSNNFTNIAEYADSYSFEKLSLMKETINNITFYLSGKLGVCILKNDIAPYYVDMETDGLIDFVRNVKGCEISAFIKQVSDNMYKISMRSVVPGLDLSEFARKYGGGGHKQAAGFDMKTDNINDIVMDLIDMAKGAYGRNINFK
ncbi:MAG: bifunctional oligoribonuclease/PAP phosphatase NrnA [Eubacteriaceae bacterium]|nr:bifunctional oligoribonuclease/PAP phosphatase NrnA [Eubacteriaceae bacterium]